MVGEVGGLKAWEPEQLLVFIANRAWWASLPVDLSREGKG